MKRKVFKSTTALVLALSLLFGSISDLSFVLNVNATEITAEENDIDNIIEKNETDNTNEESVQMEYKESDNLESNTNEDSENELIEDNNQQLEQELIESDSSSSNTEIIDAQKGAESNNSEIYTEIITEEINQSEYLSIQEQVLSNDVFDKDTLSGTCGTSAEWSLDLATNKLTIFGSGDMDDYSSCPWVENSEYIKTVEIGAGITSIGANSFNGLSELSRVILTNDIKKIGKSAFAFCRSLNNISLPENLIEIPEKAFLHCESLVSMKIPDSVENIGYSAFANCTSLEEINIPLNWKECISSASNGVVSLYYCGNIFSGCEKLKTIEVPEGITELPSYAFNGCDYLETIVLPSTLQTVNDHAFYSCYRLADIEIPDNVTVIGKYAFAFCGKLKNISIPEGIIEIPESTFAYCELLESVELADSIENIGYCAFANCTSLNGINIPLNWKSCISYASNGTSSTYTCGDIFEGCKNLKTIEVPEGVTELPSYAFSGCDYLETVVLPSTLKIIKEYAFNSCYKLNYISIPEGVTEISKNVFAFCQSLETVKLANSIEKIGHSAFSYCINLKEINIPLNWKECLSSSSTGASNTYYCGHIFVGCESLKTIKVPEGVTELPSYAFNGCDYLETVVLPSTLQIIKEYAFYGCSRLKNIIIAEGLVEISQYAFKTCSSLENIKLPDSIEKIGFQAFANCTSLIKISIPLNWKECPSSETNGVNNNYYCGNIFVGCKNLKTIEIPEGITELPSYAFNGCDYLETVVLPNTLQNIKEYAFYGCERLNDVQMKSGIASIGRHAFSLCNSLKNISMPEGVKEISAYAFYDCKLLENVKLADSIEKIGYCAFTGCTNLKRINIPLNWKECSKFSDNETDSTSTRGHIFSGCTSLNEITIPDGMEVIPAYAFNYCDSITTVNLPKSVKEIKEYAFSNCSSLTYVEYPSSLSLIGEYAFSNCSALRAVVFPESLNIINSNSFEYCSSLAVLSIPKNISKIEGSSFKACGLLSHVYYEGDESSWKTLSSDKFSSDINICYETLCDYLEPSHLLNYSYTKPTNVDFESFYGGSVSDMSPSIVDLEEVSFGSSNKKMFISIPKDSFITYGFDNEILCPDNSAILLTTTGLIYEEADVYIQTVSGKLILIGTLCESREQHLLELNGVNEYATGIKVVGKDLEGDSPGFDIVDIALVAQPTGELVPKTNTTVHMQCGQFENYDLLVKEKVFEKDSDDKATILVSADWGAHNPGRIALIQNNNVILQNESGSFADIQPGKIFDKSASIFVVLYDDEEQVVEKLKLKLKVTSLYTERQEYETLRTSINVLMNKSFSTSEEDYYVVCDGAQVESNGIIYSTNSSGVALIPTISLNEITVSKEGYVARHFTKEQFEKGSKINLQRMNDNGPVISGVWVENTDVLNNNYKLSMVSDQEITLNLEINWGKSQYKSVQLIQDQKKISFSGNSLTTTISDHFDTSEKIYIVATDMNGHTAKRVLKFVNGPVDGALNDLSGLSISFKEGMELPFPDGLFVGKNFELDLNTINTLVPITMTADSGKIYVAIGADLFSYNGESENNKVESEDNKEEGEDNKEEGEDKKNIPYKYSTKNFVKKLQNKEKLWEKKSINDSLAELKELKNEYDKAITELKGDFCIKADITVLGFAEGTYDANGNITWLDSGLIVNPSASGSYTNPFVVMAGPVAIPLYFETSLSLDVLGQLNLLFNKQAKNFMPNGEISGTINLTGGLGVGIKDFLYASGGLDGELAPYWEIVISDTDYFKLQASLSAYAKAGVACFEAKKSWELAEATWIEYPSQTNALQLLSLDEGYGTQSTSNLMDTSSYGLKNLSYLNSESEFMPDEGVSEIMVLSVGDDELIENISTETFKTNIYKESTPEFVSLSDGKKIAVWIDADSSDINKVYLYYSVYHNGAWSVPQIVYEDGTMDYEPELKVIGNNIYLAWQNATKSFVADSNLSLDEIAGSFDISVATFNEEDNSFTTSTIEYNNLDLLPTICGEGDQVYVSWVNNSENEWLGSKDGQNYDKCNSILYSKLENGTWSEPTAAYDKLYVVDSIATDYDGSLKIAYSTDTDGLVATLDDVRVFENGSEVSGDVASYGPTYCDNTLYWKANNNIVTAKTVNNEGELNTNSYQILNVNGEKAMLYVSSDGLTSKLMISYYNRETNKWSTGIPLTDGTEFVGAFSAYATENGSVNVLVNTMEVIGDFDSEDPYGTASLKLISLNTFFNLSLDDVYYVEESFCAGEEMSLTIDVSNKGSKIVNETVVDIKDSNGTVLSSTTIYDAIAPGEILTTSVDFVVPSDVTSQEIEVAVTPKGESDVDFGENYKKITLTYEHAFVENISFGMHEDGDTIIYADIVNRGYSAQTNLKALLIKDSEDGEVIESSTISNIDPLDISVLSYKVKAKQNDVYYVVLQSDDGTVLDSDFVPIYSETLKCSSEHKWDDGKVIKEPTCTTAGTLQYTCQKCNETKEEDIPMDAEKHNLVIAEAVEPTCTETGLTEGKYCILCEETLIIQKEIPELGHEFVEYKYNGDGTQTSICERDGCEEENIVTVSLPKKDKLKIELDDSIDAIGLQQGESRTLKVISGTYGELPSDKWIFKSSNSQALEVDENGLITAVYSGTGSATAKITAQFKTDVSKKAELSVKVIAKQTETMELVVSVDEKNKDLVDVVIDENTQIQTVIVSKNAVKDGKLPFAVKAISKDINGNEISANIKWTTSDKKIASVGAVSGVQGQSIVTIQKGVNDITVITATANDYQKASAVLEVDVRDYTPRLSSNNIVLNTNKEEVVSVKLITAYDALLENYSEEMVALLSQTEDVINVSLKGNDAFEAAYDKEQHLVTFFANQAMANNKTYKLKLCINTTKGLTEQDVTIKTSNTLPSVTVKQANVFNTFYKDSGALLNVTAKNAEIVNIELLDTNTFKLVYDTEEGQYKVQYADDYLGEKIDTSAKLNVWLEGYRTAVVKSFKISAKETQPKLQQSSTTTKLTYLNLNGEPINVLNKVTNENLNFGTVELEMVSNSSDYVQVLSEGTELTIHPLLQTNHKFKDNKTSHTVKLQVQDDNWLKPIAITHTVSVSTNKPNVSTKNTKVTLGTLYADNAEILFKPSISSCGSPITYIITPASTKAKVIEQAEKLVFSHVGVEGWSGDDSWRVSVGIDPANIPTAGSYAYKIVPVIKDDSGADVELNVVTVTVSVSTANPTIRLKSTTVTLNAATYSDGVTTEIIPSDSDCLMPVRYEVILKSTDKKVIKQAEKLQVNAENWNVKAIFKDINDLPANASYKYAITAYVQDLAGNEIALKPIQLTVKVNSTSPKITLSKTSVTLNSSVNEGFLIASTVNEGYEIADMKIEALKGCPSQDSLSVSYDSSTQKVCVKVLDENIKSTIYKYKINPVAVLQLDGATKTTDLKAITLSVKVTKATPTLVTSAKGSIDLANRGKGIVYTLTGSKNLNYDVEKIDQNTFELIGPDKELFEIGTIDRNSKGQIQVEVKAKAAAALKSNTAYQYQLSVKMDGLEDRVVSSLFKVKTKQTGLKFNVSGDTTIYHGHKTDNEVIVRVTSPSGASIENIEVLHTKATTVPEGALSYEVTKNEDGTWKVGYEILRASKMKVGKNYKLALAITPEGNGTNVKAQTLTITLKVKR